MIKWLKWRGRKDLETIKTVVAPDPCDTEVVSYVVLRALNQRLRGYNDVNVGSASIEDLDREQAEINRIKDWALTQSASIRREYFNWLNHFQRGLDEAVREFRTQKNKKDMERYRSESKILFDRVAACQATNTVPVPPRRNS